MPVFKWIATDLAGKIYRGIDFSASPNELEQLLLQRHLGLMRYRVKRRSILSGARVSLDLQINFFTDLLTLLQAGVLLPQALQILVHQVQSPVLRCITSYLLYQVQNQGLTLDQAMRPFQGIFGELVLATIKAGCLGSNLELAVQNIIAYLQARQAMWQQLRKALILPAVTMMIFLAVTGLVLVGVVPQFAVIFDQAQVPLDSATKWVLGASEFMRSYEALAWAGIVWGALAGIYLISLSRFGRSSLDWLVLCVPLIGSLVYWHNLVTFLQAGSLLLDGGMPVVESFEQAQGVCANQILRKSVQKMTRLVRHGTGISTAMAKSNRRFFGSDLVTMVKVGEQGGRLSEMFQRAAQVYQQRFTNRLQLLLSLLQPAMIILLGLLVAGLIWAIYIPIFNLPSVMG